MSEWLSGSLLAFEGSSHLARSWPGRGVPKRMGDLISQIQDNVGILCSTMCNSIGSLQRDAGIEDLTKDELEMLKVGCVQKRALSSACVCMFSTPYQWKKTLDSLIELVLFVVGAQVLEKPKVTRESETPDSGNNADRNNATSSQPSTLQVCEKLNMALC